MAADGLVFTRRRRGAPPSGRGGRGRRWSARLAAAVGAGWATGASGQPQPAESPDGRGPYGVVPDGYNPEEPPTYNGTVWLSVRLSKLHSVDASTNVLTLSASIWRYWFDGRLSFYGTVGLPPGAQSVAINPAEIWTPDVDVVEKVEAFQESCSTTRAVILSDLNSLPNNSTMYNVLWMQTCVLSVKCRIDLKEFPFDTHRCTLTFTPWTDSSYVLVAANTSDANLITQEFEMKLLPQRETVIWDIPIPGGKTFKRAGVRYFMYIARYSRYYVLNLIIPSVMLVVLSWIVFFTPINKGDRLSYSVTLLLAAMAVQFITADKRPPEAEDGWIDLLTMCVYMMIMVPVLETALLFRMEAAAERRAQLECVNYDVDEPSGKDRLEQVNLIDVHDSIRMVDRVARVVYPLVILVAVFFLAGPWSPPWPPRHEKVAPMGVSLVVMSIVSVVVLGLILVCSMKNMYHLGPHSVGQFSNSLQQALLQEALLDPNPYRLARQSSSPFELDELSESDGSHGFERRSGHTSRSRSTSRRSSL